MYVWGGAFLLLLTIGLSYINIRMPYFEIGARDTFAALFFVSGHYYKVLDCKIHEKYFILPIGILFVTLGVQFYQATLLNFEWWQVFPYMVTALTGLLSVFYLSKKIFYNDVCFKNLLIYIGNNTLVILTWHMLSFKIVNLLIVNFYGLSISRCAEFPVIEEYSKQGWFVLYFIIGVSIPLLLSKCKYFK